MFNPRSPHHTDAKVAQAKRELDQERAAKDRAEAIEKVRKTCVVVGLERGEMPLAAESVVVDEQAICGEDPVAEMINVFPTSDIRYVACASDASPEIQVVVAHIRSARWPQFVSREKV